MEITELKIGKVYNSLLGSHKILMIVSLWEPSLVDPVDPEIDNGTASLKDPYLLVDIEQY
jgi:hypothetical protein